MSLQGAALVIAGALACAAGAAQARYEPQAVTAEPVTILARPTVSGLGEPIRLFGSVENRRAGEVVDVQAKDCRQQFFRGVIGATTTESGAWTDIYYPSINTTLRAVWDGGASEPITIRKRATVHLRQRSAKRFSVGAYGGNSTTPFWRKRVLFQRFDRRVGTWRTVKQVVLTSSSASGTEFSASVPRGTPVRAVLPLSQARPCWIDGYSRAFRRE